MVIRAIAKLIAVLNSNRRAVEIAAAVALGLWLALVPAASLLFAVLVLIAFLVKVNLGMTIVSFLLFSLLAPVFDPSLDSLGYFLLTRPSLQASYASAYEVPFVSLTRFNDTIVSGGFVAGAVLMGPVTGVGIVLVRLYRRHVHPRIVNSRLVKAFMATPLVQKIGGAVRKVQRVWPSTA